MRKVATWPRQTGEMGGSVLNKVDRNYDDILNSVFTIKSLLSENEMI